MGVWQLLEEGSERGFEGLEGWEIDGRVQGQCSPVQPAGSALLELSLQQGDTMWGGLRDPAPGPPSLGCWAREGSLGTGLRVQDKRGLGPPLFTTPPPGHLASHRGEWGAGTWVPRPGPRASLGLCPALLRPLPRAPQGRSLWGQGTGDGAGPPLQGHPPLRMAMSMVGRTRGSRPHSSPSIERTCGPGAAGGQAGRQQCTQGRRGSPRPGQAPTGSTRRSRRAGAAITWSGDRTGAQGWERKTGVEEGPLGRRALPRPPPTASAVPPSPGKTAGRSGAAWVGLGSGTPDTHTATLTDIPSGSPHTLTGARMWPQNPPCCGT